MRRFIIWSGKNPWLLLPIIGIITAVAIFGALKLEVSSSTKAMMIENDPAIAVYEKTLATFGTDNITIILVSDDALFTPEKLARLEQLAFDLEDLPGVIRAVSLFSANNIRGVDGFLETSPLIDYLPETVAEAEVVKRAALKNPVFVRDIISEDGRTTAINLFVEADPDVKNFNSHFSRAVDDILLRYKGSFGKLDQLGMAYTQHRIVDNLLGDQVTLVPLSAFVLLMTLIITMRSKSGALLPMITAGTSIIWTAGFMGFMGIPLNILTVIVPSLIIVVGATEDIHILAEYNAGMAKKRVRSRAIIFMSNKVGTAVLLTGLTTFLGFVSIAFNQIIMLKQFGIAASFGLFVNPIITCILAPIYLHWFGTVSNSVGNEEKPGVMDRFFNRLASGILVFIRGYEIPVLIVLLGTACGVGAFVMQVKIDNDMLGCFKPGSEIRIRSQALHDTLSGAQYFNIHIKSDHAGAFLEPGRLKKIQAIQDAMAESGVFDKSISLADHISLIHREMNQGAEGFFRVPDDGNLIAQYLLFLHDDDISRYVNHDRSEANILVRHNLTSSHELKVALADLGAFMDSSQGLQGDYVFTGETILINMAADSMASGQAKSLGFLLGIVFVLMSILFVNVRAGVLSLIPNLFPVVINFGVMGILGIPLNPGTAMVAAIAIGIAVDDTIHLMTRYNKEMRVLQDRNKAIEACLRSEIKPVISTSIALSLGFAVLGFSNFLPVFHFGVLSAFVMIYAVIADLIITPILLSKVQLITLWDMVDLKLREEVLRFSPLFDGLRSYQIKKVILMGRIDNRLVGEKLFSEGDYGQSMFLILEGKGTVSRINAETGEEIVFASVSPGDVVGEIALVEAGPRSADVRVVEDMQYIEINWEGLHRIRMAYPWLSSRLFLNLSRIMGKRLIATNKIIQDAG